MAGIRDIATLGFRADARELTNADRSLQSLARSGQRTEQQTDRLNGAMRRAEQQARAFEASMSRMASIARALAAAFAVQEYIRLADAWANMNARLSLVTNSAQQLLTVQGKLYDMSQRTFSQLGETTDLYTKITRATQELNKSDSERLRLTETINKATIISGTTSATAAAGLQQLGQGLGAGVLRGEEFNSVMENTPRLAEAMAAGLGKTRSEMRLMAEQGLLTTEVVLGALKSQAGAIDAEFARLPTTFGNAMTVLQNAVLRTVGVFDQQNQVTSAMGERIIWVANNMGQLVTTAASLAAVGLVAWFGRAAQAATTYVASIGATIAGINANRAATIAAAQADLIAAQAKTTQTVATQAAIVAARQEEIARLAQANRNIAAARAAIAAASAAGTQSFALRTLRQATMELQIAEGQRVASVGALAVLGQQQVRVSAQITAARTAETLATRALSAAQALATGTATMLSRAMTFLGGPIGIITGLLTIGAIAWTTYGNKAKEAQDKAAGESEKSTQQIVDDLNKQRVKLEERISLSQKAGMTDIAKNGGEGAERLAQMRDEIALFEKVFAMGQKPVRRFDDGRTFEVSIDGLKEMKWRADELETALKGVANADAKLQAASGAEKLDAWMGKNTQYLTDAEKVTNAIATAQKELGAAFTPEIEARIRNSFGKKAAADGVKETEHLTKAAKDYLKGMQNERAELGLNAEQMIAVGAARAAVLAPTDALKKSIMAEALALIQATNANDAAVAEKERYKTAVEAGIDARLQESLAIQASVDQAQKELDTYGMGAAAITRYTVAKLEQQKAGLMLAGAYGNEIDAIDKMIGKLGQLEALQNARDDLDSLFDTTKAESFGAALRDAFGEAGSALGQLGGAFKSYSDKQDAAEQARAKIKLKYGKDDVRAVREIGKINAQEEQERIGAYADIAGAAKGMFKENTTGYKLLAGAEKGFRLLELAGQMQSLYTHLFVTGAKTAATATGEVAATGLTAAGETARNALKVPGVFMSFMSALGPYGAAAAAVAIAAVLGGAFSGGGSAVNMNSAEQVQKRQGTGTVFGGADDDKTDSIAESIELLEENSDMLLPLTQSMLGALRGIEAAMGGLSNLIVRSDGVTSGENFDIATGVVGKTLGGIWGKTKQEITDAGIMFGGMVSDLQNGAGFQQYANVTKTKSSWFGLSKSSSDSVTTGALDSDISQQFGLAFKNLEAVLRSAAPGLGRDADSVGAAVQNTRIDTTKLSLQGLTGDDLADAINAVLSKASDEAARAALPGFDAFRKLGEGYTETIVRVASGIESAQYELERLGVAAITYADIANKQGDVGAEIVRQSILAVESLTGVRDIMTTLGGTATELAATYAQLREAQDSMRMVGIDPAALDVGLLRGAGGLDSLQGALEDYFDGFFTDAEKVAAQTESMGRKFAALGLEMPTTGEAFRSLVDSTPALRGQLLMLSGSFADLMESTADLIATVDDRPMRVDLLQAEGRIAESVALSRTLELEATDALLQPMQARIWALDDERAAANLNVELLRAQGRTAESVALSRSLELSSMLESERAIKERIWALDDEREALDALTTELDGMMGALTRAVNAERKSIQVAHEAALKGYDKAIDATKTKVAGLDAVVGILDSAIAKVSVPLDKQDAVGNRQNAQADLLAMLAVAKSAGIMPDTARLERAIETLGQDSSDQFGSSREYLADRYQTAIAVTDLGDIAGDQLTIEERNLSALEGIKAAAVEAYNAEVARLDGILETAQRQVDATKGVDVSVMSVAAAVTALSGLLGKVSQGGPSGAIAGAYGSALGRAPDAEGLAFWNDKAAGGMPIDKIVESIRTSTEAQDKIAALYEKVLKRPADAAGMEFWTSRLGGGMSLADIEKSFRASDEYEKMPGFAAGGDHEGGWRKVGENGVEAEFTAPSTIVSHSDMQAMMDNRIIVDELRTVKGDLVNALKVIAVYSQRGANSNEDLLRIEREKAES